MRRRSARSVGLTVSVLLALVSCRRGTNRSGVAGAAEMQVVHARLTPPPSDGGVQLADRDRVRFDLALRGRFSAGDRFTITWSCTQCPALGRQDVEISAATVTLDANAARVAPVVVTGELTRPTDGWLAGTYRVAVTFGTARAAISEQYFYVSP